MLDKEKSITELVRDLCNQVELHFADDWLHERVPGLDPPRVEFHAGNMPTIGSVALPVGTVIYGPILNDGTWLPCDGAFLFESEFHELFSFIGYAYGRGPIGMFKLPFFSDGWIRSKERP